MRKFVLLCVIGITACAWNPFSRKNKPKPNITSEEKISLIRNGLNFYCPKIKQIYEDKQGKIHGCDSALFAGLAGVACDGIDITPYERAEVPGQMCRDWECSCFLPPNGDEPKRENGAKSMYSKDMNAGIMLNQSIKPIPDLINRMIDFLANNHLQMCTQDEAIDDAIYVGRCIMPITTFAGWIEIQKKFPSFTGPEFNFSGKEFTEESLFEKKGFLAHLAIIGIQTEAKIYGAISDLSKKELKNQAERQPNNVLYVASYELFNNGDMGHAADLWLQQCPIDRLPNNHQDYCTGYKYERDEDERNQSGQLNWKPCSQDPFEEHTGIDCAIAGWAILQGK